MSINLLALQASSHSGSAPGAISTLNLLAIGVVLVGFGMILLLTIHWYRMKDSIEKGRKLDRPKSSRDGQLDMVSQLQYMSREELKEMVLKEREEHQAAAEAAKAEAGEEAQDTELAVLAESAADTEPLEPPGESLSRPSESTPELDSGVSAAATPEIVIQADLVARLSMPTEEEIEATKKEKEEDQEDGSRPARELIQRSILSNELPEEFRRKSRKI